jgi:hypothetical protein
MDFANDHAVGARSLVLDALRAANHGAAADKIFVRPVTSFATDPDAARSFVSDIRNAVS